MSMDQTPRGVHRFCFRLAACAAVTLGAANPALAVEGGIGA